MTDKKPPQALTKARDQMSAISQAIQTRMPVLHDIGVDQPQARRLMYGALGVVANDANLIKCTPTSIARAVVQAAMLDLDVAFGLGEAYLVSYANNCTLMPGYRGWQRKAREAGYNIEAETVYSEDAFDYSLAPLTLRHKPKLAEHRGDPIGVYAYATPINDPAKIVKATWVTIEESDRARQMSKSPAWKSWPERMRRKLAVARLCKDLVGNNDGLRGLVQADAAADAGVTVYDARLDSLDDVEPATAPPPEPLPEGRQPVSKAKAPKEEVPIQPPAEDPPPKAEEW